LRVNGHHCTFELDTGALHTIISINNWNKLGSPVIRPSKFQLKSFGVTTLRIKGECDVNVEYTEQKFILSAIVAYESRPPLLGPQWINRLQLDLNHIVYGQNYIRYSVPKNQNQSQPLPSQEFKQWEEPQLVWSRVHMDFAGPIWGSKRLIIIDAKSTFRIVVDMKNDTTAKNLCNALEKVINWFGPPEMLVSDNGSPFSSHENGINHVTTPSYHPASNGFAERFVRTFEETILKEQESKQTDKFMALRNVI
jgi:predicted aspartyl protease